MLGKVKIRVKLIVLFNLLICYTLFMKFLITAFDPFNGEKINPSQEIIQLLPTELEGHIIKKLLVPTIYKESIETLNRSIDDESPDVIICLGQAGGRAGITIERVGINIDDAPIKDNAGNLPIDETIIPGGENAYFSNLPIKQIVHNLKYEGIPASVSNSAGTFVCNHLLYGLMYKISTMDKNIRGGFIHIPFIPEQCVNKPNNPSMSLDIMLKAIIQTIKTIINCDDDIKESGGATH